VAGVIAGTGDPRPGIILGRHAANRSHAPVALVGTVQRLVDTTSFRALLADRLGKSGTLPLKEDVYGVYGDDNPHWSLVGQVELPHRR
jgi:hypothetical protein